TFKFTQAETENNKTPVIESITSGSGLVGTEIEIKGKNLTGFEGDLNAWMENVNGEKGIMYSEIPYDPKGANNVMRFKIEDKLCKTDNSYSGLPCVSFLNVVPGVYKIYTMPWGVKSNVVNFEVTDATSWKTYKNDQYGFEMQYPTDWKVEGSVLRLYDEENRQISWISVSVYNNEDLRNKFNFNGDLSQWVEAEKKGIAVECYPGACNKIEDNIYIDGQKTALVYQTVAYMAPPHIIYEFIKDNLAYEVDIGFSPDGDTSVARNIVSTFKFTK
ncbi:MAG: hypothetical protein NTV36_00160, partial [Candidatus Staskawiczbacteria bacterium]|nr:hypothetical protein [Candidatus Staskawiczbacteria bacterium]